MDDVAALAEAHGLRVDTSSSNALQESLARLEVDCPDPKTLQTLTAPTKSAEYSATGLTDEQEQTHSAKEGSSGIMGWWLWCRWIWTLDAERDAPL